MEDKIQKCLNKLSLDIRQTGIARQFDQKGKIDIISFLAECILELIKNDKSREFGTKDIWEMNYFEQKVPSLFNKPKPSDPKARNEYDKFVSQPMLVFYYSGLLKGKKNKSWKFQCVNDELLLHISLNPRNAHEFLARYYEKIFVESGLKKALKNFKIKQNQESLEILRDKFYHLMHKYTPIGNRNASGENPGRTESMRIFNPVLNVICSRYNLEGTEGGHVSKHPIRYDELQYNRINFRDKRKRKELTRKQAREESKHKKSSMEFFRHQEQKAKKEISKLYGNNPQFIDGFHQCTNPEVHHIILKSAMPKFMGYTENLINLSPTQHSNLAHKSKTGVSTKQANPEYQRKLLIANSFYIERSLIKQEPFYSKIQFVEMLSDGLGLDVSENSTFVDMREKLAEGFFDKKEIEKIKKSIITS